MNAAPGPNQAFAHTKIQPPRLRQGLVGRPRLERRLLQMAQQARLVLLSAPAGFGKTGLLTQWLAALPAPAARAWVALDEDDDLGRVAGCLVAALEPCDLPWRASPEALIQAAQDGSRAGRQALVAALVNALAAAEAPRGVLVFDDAHRVADPAVFELLDALIERLPPGWSVVIASRTDPPLALARLRAQGELAELRQADLGFALDEVQALAGTRLPGAAAAQAQALHERTQGWPAGLGLLLSDTSARHAGPAGSLRDRHVFDYLASEVLERMPPELGRFLLHCAVLPELTAERCAAVAEEPRAAWWLEEIERRGLFVSVIDGEATTLRLHDLFRDFLDDRLRREAPALQQELLQRAARTEPDPLRRIGYLQRAAAWQDAEAELVGLAPRLLTDGAIGALQRLIGQFPAAVAAASPRLQLTRALAGWAQWHWVELREAAQAAAAGFAAQGDAPGEWRALSYAAVAHSAVDDNEQADRLVAQLLAQPLPDDTRCRVLLVQGWQALAVGDHPVLARAWQQMVDTLVNSGQRLPQWYECSPLPSFIGLPGMRPALLRYVAGATPLLPEQPVPLSGMLQVMQGWLQLWVGDRAGALATVEAAEADCRWLGRPTNLQFQLHALHGLVQALGGDVEGTERVGRASVEATLALPDAQQRAPYLARLVFCAARWAAIVGHKAGLRRLAAQLEEHIGDAEWVLADAYHQVVRGYLADAEGDTAAACRQWADVLAGAPFIDVFGLAGELRARLAHALLVQGRAADAAAALRPALQRLRDSGECGPLLAAGPQVLEALGAARWQGALAEDELAPLRNAAAVARRLRAGAAAGATTSAPAGAAVPALQGLSPREAEVLARIAAGDSNKLIARAFDLSPHTVKRHVANILDKLALGSRGQAAAWFNDQRAGR